MLKLNKKGLICLNYLRNRDIDTYIGDVVKAFREKYIDLENAMRNTCHTYKRDNVYNINPFHLENDVWSHTMMVLNCAAELIKEYSEKYFEGRGYNNYINKRAIIIAALLHDIGKVYTYEEKEEKQKVYFINHANVSMFYAIDIIDYFIEKELITEYDKKEILFLINKHYDLYEMDECDIINKFWKFGFDYFLDLFILVLADNSGRIALDNKRMENLDNISFAEIGSTMWRLIQYQYNGRRPEITFMVGIPYSGKTTLLKKYTDNIVSRDDIVMELSPNMTYSEAFANIDHKKVDEILMTRFNRAVEKRQNIYIDMCNTSKKSRNKFLSGNTHVLKEYWRIANVLLIGESELHKRIGMRKDKAIPQNVIDNFIKKLSIPYFDEFNEINIFVNGKLV